MDEPLFDAAFMAEHLGVKNAEHLGSTPRHGTWRVRRGTLELVLKAFPAEHEVRFQRELAVLYHVQHRHLMALHRWGKVATPVGDVFWYTAQHVPGGDVSDAMRQGRWPDPGEARSFLAAIGSALEELHRHGMVHCDVKPGNIALSHGAWTDPVLLDPGLVRFPASDSPEPGRVGTTPYMSPEQLRGEAAEPASDVFGLGVVLYKLVSRGKHPFVERGESLSYPSAVTRIGQGPRSTPPGPLGPLIAEMLASDPASRPTVAALLSAVTGGAR